MDHLQWRPVPPPRPPVPPPRRTGRHPGEPGAVPHQDPVMRQQRWLSACCNRGDNTQPHQCRAGEAVMPSENWLTHCPATSCKTTSSSPYEPMNVTSARSMRTCPTESSSHAMRASRRRLTLAISISPARWTVTRSASRFGVEPEHYVGPVEGPNFVVVVPPALSSVGVLSWCGVVDADGPCFGPAAGIVGRVGSVAFGAGGS